MELEASIGNIREGFLLVSITPEKLSVRRVRYSMQPFPTPRHRKVVETIFERDVGTSGEKERIAIVLDKMLAYLEEAQERYTSRHSNPVGVCWSFILWTDQKVYYTSGQNAYPLWWEDACALIFGEHCTLFKLYNRNS